MAKRNKPSIPAPRQAVHSASPGPSITEVQTQARDNEQMLREQLWELEVAMIEQGWERYGAMLEREFSRPGLLQILKVSRYMFLKNPLVNRAVTLQSMYVFGQGVSITSDDEATQQFIDEFVSDPKNQVELFSHQARTMKEQDLQVLGNLFFVFFSSAATGKTVIRSIPVDEIQEIHCNPQDAKEPWYYRRYASVSELNIETGVQDHAAIDAFYPDFNYTPDVKPAAIGGKPVMWNAPVFHVRVGGLSDMKFGVPETYQALDWTRAYTRHMENWSQITDAYATFAFQLGTKGGKAGRAQAKTKLQSTIGTDGTSAETNPPPNRAAVFIAGEGTELSAVKTAGATTSADEGRRLLLMVCAAFGFPESFFGDVSVGTLATAKSLDRPTELKFRDRQELWKGVIRTTIEAAIARRNSSVLAITRTLDTGASGRVTVTMPPILEHDVARQMAAIVSGATLNGSPSANTIDRETLSRMILNALGEANVDDVIAKLQAVWDEADATVADRAAAMTQAVAGIGKKQQQPAVQESVRKLAEAIEGLRSKFAA
jgi:hypothetical protein